VLLWTGDIGLEKKVCTVRHLIFNDSRSATVNGMIMKDEGNGMDIAECSFYQKERPRRLKR
jgi:hypothetical protein